ncbi:MAG TPA: ABC transporter substrate-binding protein, partial [Clostridiales bacterium]|nr:ABC transporter substrate-binding protein [Clostridiales bacterium]
MKCNNIKRFVIMALIAALLGSIITGCSMEAGSGDAEKVLVIGYDQDSELMDTIKTAWYSDALIYIHDRLVTRDYEFGYKPGLAERWDVSDDGLIWTFHLRKDVKFHNGKALTAEDVKWTIDTIKDPDTASPFRENFDAIREVNIIDEHTVEIILDYPFPNLLYNLSATPGGIHPANAYEEYGDDYGKKVVIGTGPYKFEEWIPGDKTILV